MVKINKYMEKLAKLEGAKSSRSASPFTHVIPSTSESVNFMFGPGGGLPRGYSMVIAGAPKGGKSLLVNSFIAGAHKAYEDGIVIKFDPEFKSELAFAVDNKLTDNMGIDRDRIQPIDANSPKAIFDAIEKDIYGLYQDGANIPLIIIDPITMIEGRRTGNASTVMQQQMGDFAATVGDGMSRILPKIREMKSSLIITCQIRSDIGDGMKYELNTKRYQGATVRIPLPYKLKHLLEYWTYVDRIGGNKGISQQEDDEEFFASDDEQFGHRIRTQMLDASIGPKARISEVTLDYQEGFINTHEEVFKMGTYTGVIQRVNLQTYGYKDLRWKGKASILNALHDDKSLCDQILADVRKADAEGKVKKLFYDVDEETKEESSVE